ncbi:TVP38/TMEM64 family protein [Oceanobacillus alkalisoli]|uniref:TVP38/TMEM64 family protein n=1 Tax=Oceanobacillus alkalisoli TaxID=2925113 RepID=UPI001EF119EF|nr:TVP38/TMEM64 family protein [Oceanobacillus alkalisoli]MCF3942049.1 TVP38/TMEM64 family protein [Oceanobacillus alkalisoli]MCG5101998.1 TVP38/TMEM64 family protein [Oceanobacillus alkalisoli]
MYLITTTITFQNWRTKLQNEEIDDFIQQLLNQYEGLGPLPGILLPFIEALLPFLPLMVFVLANAAAYGLLKGFFYSWIGACAGAILVFLLMRKLSNAKWVERKIKQNKQVSRVTGWVERHGFGPLFLLLCFPFSPSAIINIVAGFSRISAQQFILAVILGKTVMIFSIAYVGSSIMEFAKNPMKTIVVLIGIGLFWFIGKYLEGRLQRKVMEKNYPKRTN